MKQNWTRRLDKQVFSVPGMTGQNQHNWPDFFCKETFLKSWANNLMVFKISGLGLKKIGGLGQGRRQKIFQKGGGGNEKKYQKLAKNSTICLFQGGANEKKQKIAKKAQK